MILSSQHLFYTQFSVSPREGHLASSTSTFSASHSQINVLLCHSHTSHPDIRMIKHQRTPIIHILFHHNHSACALSDLYISTVPAPIILDLDCPALTSITIVTLFLITFTFVVFKILHLSLLNVTPLLL